MAIAPRIRAHALAVSSLAATALSNACAEKDTASPEQAQPGIRVLRGANITDTAAADVGALVIEVRDRNRKLARLGTMVRFAVMPGATDVLVSSPTAPRLGQSVETTTDGSGRAVVDVRLGVRAGVARLLVTAASLSIEDTLRYTVLAASPASVQVTPTDTVFTVGEDVSARSLVRDRFGNLRTDSVTWSLNSTEVVVSSTGRVSASVPGVYVLRVRAGVLIDSTRVTAVPDGQIAGWDQDRQEILTIRLDGTRRRIRTHLANPGLGARPRWIAGSNRIVFAQSNGQGDELRVVDSAGPPSVFLANVPATMTRQSEPAPAAAANWLFFTVKDSRCGAPTYCLARARLDGTSIELLGTGSPVADTFRPSPSPDGLKVAHAAFVNSGYGIRVLDVATGTLASWAIDSGTFPQWSPRGDLIAYMQFGIPSVVRPDGTGARRIVPEAPDSWLYSHFTWSPDGTWVVVSYKYRVFLIRVADGRMIPMPQLAGIVELDWR